MLRTWKLKPCPEADRITFYASKFLFVLVLLSPKEKIEGIKIGVDLPILNEGGVLAFTVTKVSQRMIR